MSLKLIGIKLLYDSLASSNLIALDSISVRLTIELNSDFVETLNWKFSGQYDRCLKREKNQIGVMKIVDNL